MHDLTQLEYAIRRSITVREDQDEPAEATQLEAAAVLGIATTPELSKGELLALVQTRIRSGA